VAVRTTGGRGQDVVATVHFGDENWEQRRLRLDSVGHWRLDLRGVEGELALVLTVHDATGDVQVGRPLAPVLVVAPKQTPR